VIGLTPPTNHGSLLSQAYDLNPLKSTVTVFSTVAVWIKNTNHGLTSNAGFFFA
jgi:hypothetical protein